MALIHLLLIFVLALINFARILEIYLSLSVFQLGKIALGIGLASLLTLPSGHIASFVRNIAYIKFIFLFYLMCFLSIPFSIWRGGSIDVIYGYTSMLLMCFVTILFSSNSKLVYFRIALFLCLTVMVYNMFIQQYAERMSVSLTYDSNDIGVLFVAFLPIVIAEVINSGILLRFAYIGLAVSILRSIILTGSRGAIVALCVQCLYFVYMEKKYRFISICFVMFAVLIVVFYADHSLWDRFLMLGREGEEADYNLTASGGRLSLWINGIVLFLKNPVLGVGIGQFGTAFFNMDGKVGLTAHNTYLQIATEIGFFGLLFFIASLRHAWRLINSHLAGVGSENYSRWFATKIGMLGMLVGILFISAAYSPTIYYFLGLVAVMHYAEIGLAPRGGDTLRSVSVTDQVRS